MNSVESDARSKRSTSGALRNAAIVAVATMALAGIQLFVQDGARSWRTVWAEDGRVFFAQADRHGLVTIFQGKAGYAQLAPRLLAIPATLIPLGRVANYFAVAGALVTALAGVAVFILSRDLIQSLALRLVLASASALLPVMAFENLTNITNVIWPLLFACFWALLRPPANQKEGAFGAGIAFVGAASNGLAVLFLPLAIIAATKRRSRPQHIVLAGYAAGLAFQAGVILTGGGPTQGGSADRIPQLFVGRVLAGSAVGEQWARTLSEGHGYRALEVAAVPIVAIVSYLLVRTRGIPRQLGCLAIGYSAFMFVATLAVRGTVGMRLIAGLGFSAGARYVGLSTLLLLSGIFIMVGSATLKPRASAALTILFVVQYVVVVVFAVPSTNFRSAGPEWVAALSQGAARCRTQNPAEVTVPITPGGWSVRLPCVEVRGAATPLPPAKITRPNLSNVTGGPGSTA